MSSLSLSEVSSPILLSSGCVALGGYVLISKTRTVPALVITVVVMAVAFTVFSGALSSDRLASQLLESEEAKIAQFKKNLPVLMAINMCFLSVLAVVAFRR